MYYDDSTLPSLTPEPGERIREYEIIGKIGSGGMATVYKARHTLINQIVAIKIMKPALTSDSQFCERFLREAQATAQLTGHPNIVTIHNFFEDNGMYIFVMEYIEGISVNNTRIRTLAQHIKKFGAFDIASFSPMLKGLLSGLGFAHDQSIIHRDIKPSNIMFSEKSTAKLVDFGIAQMVSDQKITRTGTAVGTPKYMSPEQVRGKELDTRSDIYSLGITIYEALTGQVPFQGDTDYEIMRKQEEDKPLSPGHINPRITKVWDHLIQRCLAKDPAQRPQSCQEISDILNMNIVTDLPGPPLKTKRHSVDVKEQTRIKDRSEEKTPGEKRTKKLQAFFYIGLGVLITCTILTLLYYFIFHFPRHKERIKPLLPGVSTQAGVQTTIESPARKYGLIGKLIAGSSYVKNAFVLCDEAKLGEIIDQLRQDEPEITYVHFTDDQNTVIASSDPKMMGAVYNSKILDSDTNAVRQRDRFYECGFSVELEEKKFGALYFGVLTSEQAQTRTQDELRAETYESVGNIIAHSSYVEDLLTMDEIALLDDIITELQTAVTDISLVHFINDQDIIIASSDPASLGRGFFNDVLDDKESIVRQKDEYYEGGFSVRIGKKKIGALYFQTAVIPADSSGQ
jgi:serine/threonine protein kinase